MEHSFDVDVAKKYGIIEAIIIRNLQFWITKNKANEKHRHEDRTWTYNSTRAFSEIFPYLTVDQIRRPLEKLLELGVLQKGNFNKKQYDRTAWYSFVNEKKWLNSANTSPPAIWQESQMDLVKTPNGENGKESNNPDQKVEIEPILPFGENPKPIPDNKHVIKNNIHRRLSELLINLILKRNPENRKPNLDIWDKQIDLMIRRDKRTPENIEKVMRWCQKDKFWQNNILSTNKLREQYDRLKLQMESGNNRGELNESKYKKLLSSKPSASA